jgi:low temperature requirement protein LtrA
MAKREWWQKPYLRKDEEFELHRAVTWLELFFDLVFVVVIARLAHNLAGDITVSGTLTFIFMFIPVWWVWNAATYYTERFESEGLENRFFTFLKMIAVAGMAIYSHHGLEENFWGFALSFWFARFINMIMWARAGKYVKEFRPVSNRFLIGFFGFVTPLIAISLFLEGPWRLIIWGLAILIDIITPYFTLKQQAKLPRLSTSKFPERFGLLTIIVLGESIVGVINGLSDLEHLTLYEGINGIFGIFISIGLWWVYFDFIARRAAKSSVYTALLWVYLHLLFMICVTMTGVGIFASITDMEHGHLTEASRLLLTLGAGFSIIFLGLLETTLHRKEDEPTHPVFSPLLKVIAGVAVLLLGGFVSGLNTTMLLLIILLALFVQQLYAVIAWFSQDVDIDIDGIQ